MSDTFETNGSCLCKAVRFTATNMSKNVGACHCSICRKWSGGPLMAVDCGTEVSFENEDNITIFNSSEWAERGFCKQCGSHLFYRLKKPRQYFIPAGIFDDVEYFEFDHQVFIDNKPTYYSFANKTTVMTEAEIFAQFSATDK